MQCVRSSLECPYGMTRETSAEDFLRADLKAHHENGLELSSKENTYVCTISWQVVSRRANNAVE